MKREKRTLIVGTVFLAVAVLLISLVSAKIQISDSTEPTAGELAGSDNIVRLNDGTLIAVWEDDNNDLACGESHNDGADWIVNTSSDITIKYPSIATNGSRILIVAENPNSNDILYIESDVGCGTVEGASLTKIPQMSNPENMGTHALAYNGITNLWVMCMQHTGSDVGFGYAPINNDGNWSVVEVEDDRNIAGGCSIAVAEDGEIWIATDDGRTGDPGVFVYNSNDNFASFNKTQLFTLAVVEVDIATRNGNIVVVAERGSDNDMYLWWSSDGVSWSEYEQNLSDGRNIKHPVVCLDSQNVSHILVTYVVGDDTIYYYNFSEATGWGGQVELESVLNNNLAYPSIICENFPSRNELEDYLRISFVDSEDKVIYFDKYRIIPELYSIGSYHRGLSGGLGNSSSYDLRFTRTYQQPGDRNASSSSYVLNFGWFNLTVEAQAVGNATINEIFFSNESVFNYSNVFNGSEIVYDLNLTYVGINCTAGNGSVSNVTFRLYNVEDDVNYVNTTGYTFNENDLYVLNLSYQIRDSGNWTLYVSCEVSSGGAPVANQTLWEIAWGTIVVNLIQPIVDTTVALYGFFTFSANVSCSGGECGVVNVTLDPEEVVSPRNDLNEFCETSETCMNVTIKNNCVNETVENCGEECSIVEEEVCKDIITEELIEECGVVCKTEEVCIDNSNETVCENLEGCEDICENVTIEITTHSCNLENVTNCVDVNCTSEIVENCTIVIEEICSIEEVCETVETPENKTVDPRDNEKVIEPMELVLDFNGLNVTVSFETNVTIINSEIIDTLVGKVGLISIQSLNDSVQEFEYITPILAVELEGDSSATVVLPKNDVGDLEVIVKCDNWNFNDSNCDSEWYVYATIDELEQDSENVWFIVDSFSAYAGGNITSGDTSFLRVWDENDIGMPGAVADITSVKIINENVTFFADYKIARNATKISDGDCSILINGSSRNMSYDGSEYYNYTMNMSEAKAYDYTISCSHTIYDNLTVEDRVVIGNYNNQTKGAISTIIGAIPFYTTSLNPQGCTLRGGETCDVSWQVNSTGILDKVYDFFVEAVGNFISYTTSSHINITISANDTTAPVFISTIVTPSAVFNGSDVLISANVMDNVQVDSVWGIITRSDGTNISMGVGSLPYIYTTSSNIYGRYNITYYANDSSGNNAIATTWFEVAAPLNTTININISIDVGLNISSNFTFKLIHPDSGDTIYEIETNRSFSASVPNIIYDIMFLSVFNNTMNLTMRQVNLSANVNESISLDKHKQIAGLENSIVTYGINTGYTFDVSELIFSYIGESYTTESNLQLWKCDNYNFAGRSCSGSWADTSTAPNIPNDYFEYSTLNFSGFGIKEYFPPIPVPTPTTGGGGGGGGVGITIPIEEAEEELEVDEGIPSQLFDITWNLEDSIIQTASELSGVVTFESFGTIPTLVNLTFIIIDSAGNEIYREESDITVTTEEILRWNFESLEELSEGKYTTILETLYGDNVKDEFRQDFEIRKMRIGITGRVVGFVKGTGKWYGVVIILGALTTWLIWFIVKKRKRRVRKNRTKKKEIKKSLAF